MCDVVSVYYRWYTRYNKQRILHLHFAEHLRAPTITKVLAEEGIKTSRRGVLKLLQKHYHSKTITRLPGSGRRSLVTAEVKRIVEEKMRRDNEATDHQLHALLISKGFPISLRTILSCRTALGWTFRGSAYCQLIRTVNKAKRLEWAQQVLGECENGFGNVVWTDECTVQLETHRQFCCRKKERRGT